jgi:protein tyrosine/serine phosphatase
MSNGSNSGASSACVRHLDWPGFVNARTLEGLTTRYGPVLPGRLFRSDEPVGDVETVATALSEDGVTTVLDLRSRHEVERRPGILSGRVGYHVAPLVDPRTDHLRDPAAERSLLDLYTGSIDRNGRTICEALRRIAEAPVGGVLVHCAAGKDRTGILIAVLLSLLGTPAQEIVDDYAETEARLAPYFEEELAAIEDEARRERVAARQHSTPETMCGLLRHLDERHGGAEAYAAARGLTSSEVEALAARLTG